VLNGSGANVYLGNGNGTFQAVTTYSTGSNTSAIAGGDWNGDGRQDLATVGSNGVTVLLGNGNGTFQAALTSSSGSVLGVAGSGPPVAVGDFNGDGKPDLATYRNTLSSSSIVIIGTVSIVCGSGDGTFKAPVTFTAGAGVNAVLTGDWNGDGKIDVATSLQSYDIGILYNTAP
jgi:hypothetical protein